MKAKRAITVGLDGDNGEEIDEFKHHHHQQQQNGSKSHRKKNQGKKVSKGKNSKKNSSIHSDDDDDDEEEELEEVEEDEEDDFVQTSVQKIKNITSKASNTSTSANFKRRGRPPVHTRLSINDDISRLALNTSSTPKGKNRKTSVSDNDSEWSQVSSITKNNKNNKKSMYNNNNNVNNNDNDNENYISDGESEKDLEREYNMKIQRKQNNSFTVHTFSEWPGQSEGEPIDLPYIWNVISMMYPEDYSIEVKIKYFLPSLLNQLF